MERRFEYINGQSIDVSTVFDKSMSYTPTQEEVDLVMNGCRKHLNEFFPGLLHEEVGLHKMFDADGDFWETKGWLIQAFKKHPNYNGRLQIVIKNAPYRRGISMTDLTEFFDFCDSKLSREKYYEDINGNRLTRSEALRMINSYDDQEALALRYYRRWRHKNDLLYNKAKEIVLRIQNKRSVLSDAHYIYGKEQRALHIIFDFIRENGADAQFIDEELSTKINKFFGDDRFSRKGSKVSKLIGKIAKRTNLTSVTDIRDVSFTNQDGEYVQRTKDFGWNYQFAKLGDSINPIEETRTAVLSLLPVDFYRMSFGYKWSSCMTTDKENRRHVPKNYHGMYCGGTESYMLDNATFLLYYLPEGWNGTEPEWEDKLKRCNFHLGEDKIVQGRAYPDGRDGGEASLATDMRNLVQRIISDLFDQPNYWKVEKGTCANGNVTYSEGSHYRDYLEYEDTSVSFWKRIDGYINDIPFTIGTDSICPECGEYHTYSDNIFCMDCEESGYICEGCGCRIREEDVLWLNGEPYCPDCATVCADCGEVVLRRDATYVESEDGCVCDWCLDRHYTYCEDVQDYVHNDNVVETEEGNYYHEDSMDMYECCEHCGEYHDIENMNYDEESGGWYCDECYEALLARREEAESSETA